MAIEPCVSVRAASQRIVAEGPSCRLVCVRAPRDRLSDHVVPFPTGWAWYLLAAYLTLLAADAAWAALRIARPSLGSGPGLNEKQASTQRRQMDTRIRGITGSLRGSQT